MKKNLTGQSGKRKWILLIILILLTGIVFLIRKQKDPFSDKPILAIEIPQKVSIAHDDILTLDVTISDLGNAVYPAASMSISFDSSCLEFVGLEEGNVFVSSDENSAGKARQLPEWSCNPVVSNETGLINIIYLDLTGGKHAFRRDLLAKDNNVVFRLQFRLRGSVRTGDVYDLILEDAVFASSDEIQSLAMTTNTLKTKNSRLVIGD